MQSWYVLGLAVVFVILLAIGVRLLDPGRADEAVVLETPAPGATPRSFVLPTPMPAPNADALPPAIDDPAAQTSATAQAIREQPLIGETLPPLQLAPEFQPVLVPDANDPLPPVVFARHGNIWLNRGDGSDSVQITTFDYDVFAREPAFSPDGQQIAFIAISQPPITATIPLPVASLYVMDADGADLREVWRAGDSLLGTPSWAPDGTTVYVSSNGVRETPDATGSMRRLQIVQVDLATGTPQPILDDALDPSVAPDGAQLGFVRLSPDGYTMSLEIANLDGSNARPILAGTAFQGFYAPRFAPDGETIIVAAIGGPETDAEGYPLTAPTSHRSLLDRLANLVAPPSAAAHGLPWDLWTVNVDGSELRRLTRLYEDLPMAVFSPDGSEIAFMGYGGIYLMDADGNRMRRLDPIGDHGGIDWQRTR